MRKVAATSSPSSGAQQLRGRKLDGRSSPRAARARAMNVSEASAVGQRALVLFKEALERLGWSTSVTFSSLCAVAAGEPALFRKHAMELVALEPDVAAVSTPAVTPAPQREPHGAHRVHRSCRFWPREKSWTTKRECHGLCELLHLNGAQFGFLHLRQRHREHPVLELSPDLVLIDATRKAEAPGIVACCIPCTPAGVAWIALHNPGPSLPGCRSWRHPGYGG